MDGFLGAKQDLAVLVAWYVFSNAVDSLPAPTSTSSRFYQWLFAFLHGLAGNLATAAKSLKGVVTK